MTKVNKIVMHGFKSFARRTEIPFSNKFSCVLGPNGSGKSNILDAICFVLGKASSKGLRAQKSANLIYNGGKTKKPAKSGEVSIYFDNQNKVFPLDVDEIKITRIVKQNDQSKYKINDETRTRQQIVDLLSSAKIDPDGYNIILQGDVIQLIEMSNTERRKIMEEISGISIYEEKKEKAVREVKKVEERLKEADIILSERKIHLKELKTERNQALKFKKLKDQIDSNKATLLSLQLKEKETSLSNYLKLDQELRETFDKYQNTIKEKKQSIKEKKEEVNKINKEIESKGEKEQVKLHKEVEDLRVEIGTDKNRIKACDKEVSRIKFRKEQLEKDLEDLKDKVEKLVGRKKELLELKNSKQKEIKQVEDKLKQFREKNSLDNASKIDKEIEEIDSLLEEKQNKMQKLREEQQKIFREKDQMEYKIQSMDEKISKVLQVKKEHKKQIDELKDMSHDFKKKTLELNKLLNEDSTLAGEISDLRSKLVKLNNELSKYHIKESSMKASLTASQAVKTVLAQKDSIYGIYGQVSELGDVSTKYATALQVAAGGKINNIVVDSDSVASQCIKLLKKNRSGTASFIPLNKIRTPRINPEISKIKNAKGVHGHAVDLISYDSKFKKAFYYLFGNTLVVEDINVARRIGVGNFKMVTLDGDISELSGVMKGGYRSKRSASVGFKQKEITSTIKELETQIANYEASIYRKQKKRDSNEEKISKLREEKASLEGEIIKREKSLHLETGDLDSSKNMKKELTAKVEELEKRLRELQSEISKANRELANNKIQKQKLRNKINELRNPRLLAELNTFEQKRDELKEAVSKISSEIKSLDVQNETIFLREKENINKILKQVQKENSDFNKEKQDLEQKIKKQESILKEKEEKEKEFYEKFKSLFNKRNKIDEEIMKLEEDIIKKDEKLRKIEIKLNTSSLETASVKAKIAAIKEQLERYKDIKTFDDKSISQLKREITQFENMIANIGNVNMKALEIYDKVEQEYNNLKQKKENLESEKIEINNLMEQIESKKKDIFMKTYDAIERNFKKLFKTLSTKGDAELMLENPEQPFEGGLLIKVRLSGKKFLDIRSLSGGEKTMTALAFIFAIQEYEPASFYVLDEVDAALDKQNSEKLAKLIEKYSKKAQYIIISHNDALISEADTLFGTSMDEHGISKVVSIEL